MDWQRIHKVQDTKVNFQREELPVVLPKMISSNLNLIYKAKSSTSAKRLFLLGSHYSTPSKYTRKSSSESTKNSRSSVRATPTASFPNGNTAYSPQSHQDPKTQMIMHISNFQKYSQTTPWQQTPQNKTRIARPHSPGAEARQFCSQPKWNWNQSTQAVSWRCCCVKWGWNNRISIMIQEWLRNSKDNIRNQSRREFRRRRILVWVYWNCRRPCAPKSLTW